jgi:hypothetical protein
MTDATSASFVQTREYRRFREFCDACRRNRSIGLCYGPPGVGKTLSARRYADWDRVASADPFAGRAAFRADEVPGNGCVLYTASVVSSPRRIEAGITGLRRKLRDLILQAIRAEAEPGIVAARRALESERDRPIVFQEWLTGKPERLTQAEAAASEAALDLVARSREVGDPTELLLVDEVDWLKMTGLEQLRAIFDAGGIGLVLIGMPGLERRLARYAQLYSRIGFVHEFRPLAGVEVRAAGELATGRGKVARGPTGRRRGGRGDHPDHRRELPIAGPAAGAGRPDSRTQRARCRDPRGRPQEPQCA